MQVTARRASDERTPGAAAAGRAFGLAIVPAFNEEESVADVVADIRRSAPGFDIVVIDDGSLDETAKRARLAGADVVSHPFNLGIGGAVQSGFKYALERGYDYAVQVDGDGQHDARYIETLVEAITSETELDLVGGSRFLGEGRYETPFARRMGIIFFAKVLSVMVGEPITDPTSGFRVANRRAIELFARDYPHDYPEVEAASMIFSHRLRMKEVPVEMRHRTGGSSSITMSQSVYYMIKVVLALFVGLFRKAQEFRSVERATKERKQRPASADRRDADDEAGEDAEE